MIEGASVSASTGMNTLKETDEVLSLTPDVAQTLLVSHAAERSHVSPLFCPALPVYNPFCWLLCHRLSVRHRRSAVGSLGAMLAHSSRSTGGRSGLVLGIEQVVS